MNKDDNIQKRSTETVGQTDINSCIVSELGYSCPVFCLGMNDDLSVHHLFPRVKIFIPKQKTG